MMDKIEKIEQMLELLLEKLIKAIFFILNKLIPNPVRAKFISLSQSLHQFLDRQFQKAKTFIIETLNKSKDLILSLYSRAKKIFSYPLQKKFNENFFKIKEFLKKTPLKTLFVLFGKYCQPKIDKFQQKFNKVASSQMFIAGGALVMIIGGLTGIYFSSKEIYQKEYPYRAPASHQEYDYRPDYKSYQQKTLKVQNIKIPLQVERAGKINSITIDFTIRTTTKFAKYYLENYEYKLKDYFFTSVEPVNSDFAIENEGKEVLKEKIQEEINYFLRLENVEGEVEEVEIQFIIAS